MSLNGMSLVDLNKAGGFASLRSMLLIMRSFAMAQIAADAPLNTNGSGAVYSVIIGVYDPANPSVITIILATDPVNAAGGYDFSADGRRRLTSSSDVAPPLMLRAAGAVTRRRLTGAGIRVVYETTADRAAAGSSGDAASTAALSASLLASLQRMSTQPAFLAVTATASSALAVKAGLPPDSIVVGLHTVPGIPSAGKSGGASVSAVAGGVVGVLVVLGAVIVVAFIARRRRQERRRAVGTAPSRVDSASKRRGSFALSLPKGFLAARRKSVENKKAAKMGGPVSDGAAASVSAPTAKVPALRSESEKDTAAATARIDSQQFRLPAAITNAKKRAAAVKNKLVLAPMGVSGLLVPGSKGGAGAPTDDATASSRDVAASLPCKPRTSIDALQGMMQASSQPSTTTTKAPRKQGGVIVESLLPRALAAAAGHDVGALRGAGSSRRKEAEQTLPNTPSSDNGDDETVSSQAARSAVVANPLRRGGAAGQASSTVVAATANHVFVNPLLPLQQDPSTGGAVAAVRSESRHRRIRDSEEPNASSGASRRGRSLAATEAHMLCATAMKGYEAAAGADSSSNSSSAASSAAEWTAHVSKSTGKAYWTSARTLKSTRARRCPLERENATQLVAAVALSKNEASDVPASSAQTGGEYTYDDSDAIYIHD